MAPQTPLQVTWFGQMTRLTITEDGKNIFVELFLFAHFFLDKIIRLRRIQTFLRTTQCYGITVRHSSWPFPPWEIVVAEVFQNHGVRGIMTNPF